MKKDLKKFIADNQINIYDIAIMDDKGIESFYCQPCNECNENYSMTKFYIMTMIGVLCDNSLLNTDDRITSILRKQIDFVYDSRWDEVTVHDCLSHSMGVEYGALDIDRDEMSDYKYDDYLRMIMETRISHKPVTYRFYTDCAHYILSRVITAIVGLPADEIITKKILNPLNYSQASFAHCPNYYTIGSSGSYMKAKDVVKIAWLYLNNGTYNGRQIISEEWIKRAEEMDYDLCRVRPGSSFFGKGGMNGQMLMYSREKNIAVSWHSYERNDKDKKLFDYFDAI